MQIKRVLLILAICLLFTFPTSAQDATAEATGEVIATTETVVETSEPPAGLPSLVLLIGLGAVAAVGGVAFLRQRTSGGDAIE